MVLIDTSAWVDFFHDKMRVTVVGKEVDALLLERCVITTGMVLAEVLQGASDDADLSTLGRDLRALPFIEVNKAIWETAANWSYDLRRKGLTTPLSDLVIAAAAMSEEHEIYATDPHFERVAGLVLHQARL